MNKIYRTLLVCKKVKDQMVLVYGHTIEWLLTDTDYQIDAWKKFEKKGLIVFYTDLESSQELNAFFEDDRINIDVNDKSYQIDFKINGTGKDFIVLAHPSDEFNPIGHYPIHADVYFGADDFYGQSFDQFIVNHTDSLEIIENMFRVKLNSHPEVIGCFFKFYPTRILTKFKGFEKDGGGFKYEIFDEFDSYSESVVKITASFNEENEAFEFKLSENPITFNCGYIPDSIKTEIFDTKGSVIYESNYSILKRITVGIRVKESSLNVAGEKVERYSETDKIKVVE